MCGITVFLKYQTSIKSIPSIRFFIQVSPPLVDADHLLICQNSKKNTNNALNMLTASKLASPKPAFFLPRFVQPDIRIGIEVAQLGYRRSRL